MKIDDHKAPQLQVVEQQVQIEIIVTHRHMHLATDEREPGSQLQQKFLYVIDQPQFQIPLDGVGLQRQEVEHIRIFERLMSQI